MNFHQNHRKGVRLMHLSHLKHLAINIKREFVNEWVK